MKLFRELFFSRRFFYVSGGFVFAFILSYFIPQLFFPLKLLFYFFLSLIVIDGYLLFSKKDGISGYRITPEKLSNGDDNEIKIYLTNNYQLNIYLRVIDELPEQLQIRNSEINVSPESGESILVGYKIRPVKRGEYHFGNINVLASTKLKLVERRIKLKQDKMIPVYPSFIQMRKYELLAISNRLTEIGIKKIRRIGQSTEFDQIKDYVKGDDYRTINWKATARKSNLMVNHYQDERSQQVFSVIDCGRAMKMPFDGLSLLDYAINTSLVISDIALIKKDKIGLITFSKKVNSLLPAQDSYIQLKKIMEVLYRQETSYPESSFENLAASVFSKLHQRSLILLFTNFETLSAVERQLGYLRKISARHVLVVIFFHNTGLKDLIESDSKSVEQIYHKTIAEKFEYEKRLIVKELNKHSIQTILTAPQTLSVNVINKYLEIKSRNLI